MKNLTEKLWLEIKDLIHSEHTMYIDIFTGPSHDIIIGELGLYRIERGHYVKKLDEPLNNLLYEDDDVMNALKELIREYPVHKKIKMVINKKEGIQVIVCDHEMIINDMHRYLMSDFDMYNLNGIVQYISFENKIITKEHHYSDEMILNWNHSAMGLNPLYLFYALDEKASNIVIEYTRNSFVITANEAEPSLNIKKNNECFHLLDREVIRLKPLHVLLSSFVSMSDLHPGDAHLRKQYMNFLGSQYNGYEDILMAIEKPAAS